MDQLSREVCVDNLRRLNLQYELYFGAMSLALGALANERPAWLHAVSLPIWYSRYAGLYTRFSVPKRLKNCYTYINVIRADIFYLLEMIEKSGDEGLLSIPEVATLKKIKEEWIEHCP
jgi:hypothetical protein